MFGEQHDSSTIGKGGEDFAVGTFLHSNMSVLSKRYMTLVLAPLLSLVAAVALLLPFPVFSEEPHERTESRLPKQSDLMLPPGLPPLPSPQDNLTKLIVTERNVALFHDVLLAPLAQWIKEKRCSIKVVQNLDFSWQLSPAWRDNTMRSNARYSLGEQGDLVSTARVPEGGYPFGFATNIDQDPDPVKKAYKILWNAQYTLALAEDLLYDLQLDWLTSKALLRSANGVYYRRFFVQPHDEPIPKLGEREPHSADVKADTSDAPPLFGGPNDILIEEVLRLLSPPVVFGFGEVGWRFRGGADDRLWIHSPVLGRSREVFSSNRGDPLLGGLLSFDDLFVFSEKVQSVKARVVDEKVLLLPFPSLTSYRLDPEEITNVSVGTSETSEVPEVPRRVVERTEDAWVVRGVYTRPGAESTMVLWNFETGEMPGGSHWFPSTATFVPRRVWIVEASPRDPLYSGGRRVVIIDKESMLPFYKIVYNQKGELQKFILGGWALGSTESGDVRFPFLAFTLGVDARGEVATSVTTHSLKLFLNPSSKLLSEVRKMLDISSYRSEQRASKNEARSPVPVGEGGEVNGVSPDEATAPTESSRQLPSPGSVPPQESAVEPDSGGSPDSDQGGF